ncbi:MAG: hypothetical protein CMN73_16770 [Sphingomonas sp.]|nr:hypothetical protein [Sphingomonas sp.]
MNTSAQKPRILQAIEALHRADPEQAVAILNDELRLGDATGARWMSASKLAANIGEIDIAIESARRYSRTPPVSLERLLYYWGELATHGRVDAAQAEVARMPADVRDHPAVLHFQGTITGQEGDFERAIDFYRRALAKSPLLPQSWFALAMIKKFTPGDADLDAMDQHRAAIAAGGAPAIYARFLYGLGKAWQDCGEIDKAFACYSEGAALRQAEEKFDLGAVAGLVDRLITDFTPERMRQLKPPRHTSDRAIFVNGLPRSGTTLVEQIIASHSQVSDGGEIGLLRPALLPTGDFSFAGALRYQERDGSDDPWGDIGRRYERMLDMRFGSGGRIIDKTLVHSHFMGLLLHALPGSNVIWMRRNPEDVALSCFRNFFTDSLPWSWSLTDIAEFFRIEDRLFAHWSTQFPDRILVVPYEEMAADPGAWIPRILNHVGLPPEPQVFESHKTQRRVRTASLQQVRAPISTARIGLSKQFDKQMQAFRDVYYR